MCGQQGVFDVTEAIRISPVDSGQEAAGEFPQLHVGALRAPYQYLERPLRGDAISSHQHALGLFDLGTHRRPFGDLLSDATLQSCGELDVEPADAGKTARVVPDAVGDHHYEPMASGCIDEAMTAAARLTSQQSIPNIPDLLAIVGMGVIEQHLCG